MVDERRAAILRAVVQEYIETSQPVSSTSVVNAGSVVASPATVRSEMAALEREGYLQQPHTSAGRIPTDRGYRFFVDGLDAPGRLGEAQQQDVREFFARTSGEIVKTIHETGRLLTGITGAAAVVVGPDHEMATVRSVQVVGLGSRTAVVVVVFSDASVDKHTIEIADGTTDDVIAAASTVLTRRLDGKTLGAVDAIGSGNVEVDQLATTVLNAIRVGHHEDGENVFVGGASQLARSFEAVEVVRNILSFLEEQYVVVTLIRDLLERGMTVSIGAENNLQPLAQCSLVVAPTIVDGEQRGSIAVLGPTRMDYSQAMAAVTVVSRRLGEKLGGAW